MIELAQHIFHSCVLKTPQLKYVAVEYDTRKALLSQINDWFHLPHHCGTKQIIISENIYICKFLKATLLQ